mmetsp:Transcript_40041/g.78707  ORF Transcript_40041/g.78707 Transcript_40041/m.78707 type:complete len:218 (-) Transcript_40041:885-1538(-)
MADHQRNHHRESFGRQLLTKGRHKLQSVRFEDGKIIDVGGLQLRNHLSPQEVHNVDIRVSFGDALALCLTFDGQGEDNVHRCVLGHPVLSGALSVLLQQLANVLLQNLRDLVFKMQAEPFDKVACSAPSCVGVRPFNVSTDVIQTIHLEQLLVGRPQLQLWDHHLLAQHLQRFFVAEQLFVPLFAHHARQKAYSSAGQQVELGRVRDRGNQAPDLFN